MDKKETTMKTLEEYMAMPWITHVEIDFSEGVLSYVASHPELSSCLGQGNTLDEAIEDLRLARQDLLSVMIEFGDEIPEPMPLEVPTSVQYHINYAESYSLVNPVTVKRLDRSLCAA